LTVIIIIALAGIIIVLLMALLSLFEIVVCTKSELDNLRRCYHDIFERVQFIESLHEECEKGGGSC